MVGDETSRAGEDFAPCSRMLSTIEQVQGWRPWKAAINRE